MNKAIIYTKPHCTFCNQAKAIFESNNIEYKERDISDPSIRHELLTKLPSVKTVPQIYYDGQYIGGYSDLEKFMEEQH